MMSKPHNLFLLLAALAGMLAFVFGVLVSPSESMPERPHLAFIFICMMGVMGAIGAIYWLMERLKRPIPGTIGKGHYLITLVAVTCGIICTVTAYDGVENPAWTKVPSFLSLKLFTVSVGVFLFGIAWAIVARKPKAEFSKLAD